MVVRFLAAVSLLLALILTPLIGRSDAEAAGASTVVSVAPVRVASGPEAQELSPLVALRERIARQGREEVLRADPELPRRLLLDLAAGTREDDPAPAGAVLLALGESTRRAALELLRSDGEAERETAREILDLIEAMPEPRSDETTDPRREW